MNKLLGADSNEGAHMTRTVLPAVGGTAPLSRYEAARQALAEARRVDEVKDILDKAIGMAAYAKQAKDRDLIDMAAEIRLRAERRLGELMAAQKQTLGTAKGGGDGSNQYGKSIRVARKPSSLPTLADQGIDKNLADRARKMAALTEAQFETRLEQAKKEAHWAVGRTWVAQHILATGCGPNSAMVANAAALYIRDGDVVADVTYGRGAFWTETDLGRFKLVKSDANPIAADVVRADLRQLRRD
jgi:hypothetical protein